MKPKTRLLGIRAIWCRPVHLTCLPESQSVCCRGHRTVRHDHVEYLVVHHNVHVREKIGVIEQEEIGFDDRRLLGNPCPQLLICSLHRVTPEHCELVDETTRTPIVDPHEHFLVRGRHKVLAETSEEWVSEAFLLRKCRASLDIGEQCLEMCCQGWIAADGLEFNHRRHMG